MSRRNLAFFYFCLLSINSCSSSILDNVPKFINNIIYNAGNLPLGLIRFIFDSIKFSNKELPDTKIKNGSEYDFIIIGAGSAGSVIASRLCEISNFSILLIEAGGQELLLYGVPFVGPFLHALKFIMWDDKAEPSPNYCTGWKNGVCNVLGGKVMGGSSAVHDLITTRGSPMDFDSWAESGNDGWSYKEMLPYFIRQVNLLANVPGVNMEQRGTNGPLPVSYGDWRSTISNEFVAVGKEWGFSNDDYDTQNQISFAHCELHTKNNERYSVNRAYLHTAKGRPNLSLRTWRKRFQFLNPINTLPNLICDQCHGKNK